ncbi:MAG: hypothetical protein ABFD00_06065 [Chloroherpetonaceae bacterium]
MKIAKNTALIFVISLSVSCTLPNQNIVNLIDGKWGGWTIEAENGMIFRTQIGIRTINFPVQIIEINEHWYIWNTTQWQNEIYPITSK